MNCVVTSNTDFYSCYIPKAKKPQEKPRTIKEIEEENKKERGTYQEMDQIWAPIPEFSTLRSVMLGLELNRLYFGDRDNE